MASKDKKQKVQTPREGMCGLLNVHGKFAKSHLIPRALTGAQTPGERFIETGRGTRPIRRFTSWYDHQLVIAAGEKILSEIDDAGIAELRKHRLVWSGWEGKKRLHIKEFIVAPDPTSGVGMRSIKGVDARSLRLFFLSLLWRALKTKIKEFGYLPNLGIDLDLLGQHLIKKDSGDPAYLPVAILQISTMGFTHNHSPTVQELVIPDEDGNEAVYQFYRFYMQGVIAHIYPMDCAKLYSSSTPMFVGGDENLVVITHKFENSRQLAEATDSIVEAVTLWPQANP